MDILYITSSRMPTEKAHGYQIMKMCEALQKSHRVLLLSPTRRRSGRLRDSGDIYSYYSVRERFEIRSLPSLDLPFLKRIDARLWFVTHATTYSLVALIWILLHRKEFDLIYSRDAFGLYAIDKLNVILKLPLIHESHVFPSSRMNFEAKLAKRLDGLVVVTKGIRDSYVRAGVEEAKVIVEPDAVDLQQFDIRETKRGAREKLGIPVDIRIASFVGQFHTMGMEKGIPEIIASAKYVLEEFSELYFYFVGGPLDKEERYRDIIEKERLPHNKFVFRDRQAIGDIPFWMNASDILLMPHPSNPFYSFYVSPLKMFEYMASRRPIVGSRLPAIEEILIDRRNALLGVAGNPESIGENIRTLLRDPQLCERLAERAFTDVKRYTWHRRAERITRFMRQRADAGRVADGN